MTMFHVCLVVGLQLWCGLLCTGTLCTLDNPAMGIIIIIIIIIIHEFHQDLEQNFRAAVCHVLR